MAKNETARLSAEELSKLADELKAKLAEQREELMQARFKHATA